MAPDSTLHLVRHAQSRMDSSAPSWDWSLAPSAPAGAGRLRDADVLPRNALWVSSSEPKALLTAGLLTDLPVQRDDGLREALREPEFLDHEEFHRRVLRSFDVVDASVADGWEPLVVTQTRAVRAARSAIDRAAGRDVVLVGHGTALTMLVAALTGRPPDVEAWKTMRMPDHLALELPVDWVGSGGAHIVAGWGAWTA